MEKIKFSHEEGNALEVTRNAVFELLRTEKIDQFPRDASRFENVLEFSGDIGLARKKFLLLAHEILWELIIQRVISPGSDSSNPDLPFFRVTDYGKKILETREFNPHDPANYLDRYNEAIPDPDPVAFKYLKESLRCFNSGCYLAATMMLGVASEVIFLNLCSTLLDTLHNRGEQDKFRKIMSKISMVEKFKFVREKLEEIINVSKKALPETTIIALLSVFDLIRTQRNDIGHPQEDSPQLTRDQVFIYMHMFPEYCETVRDVQDYLVKNMIKK